ncbi:MAG TPA: D-2-hydroxyacid dehydrogenase [Feifaniaceae bacterium]|nr:D-2-hydroxyacid dehydrogenase [Feifaniaceae bacterium]
MYSLLVLIPFNRAYRKRLLEVASDACEITFVEPGRSIQTYAAQLERADILLGDPEPGDLQYCKNLRFMQTTWAGVDHYLNCGSFPQTAVLCNMTGAYGPVIAEHEMGVILALCRQIPQYLGNQRNRKWERTGTGKSLEDAVALILGAGDIGQELARRLRPFVREIIGVRRVPRGIPRDFDRMITLAELDQNLPLADVVACSLPDTPATHHLFNADRLRLMKEDAIFVNVGRGGLVVSDDLAAVMEEGRFWGVSLDVTEPEPLPRDHPLWGQERILITPHVSGSNFGSGSPTERRIRDFSIHNLENYLHGRPLENVVDFSTGYRKL